MQNNEKYKFSILLVKSSSERHKVSEKSDFFEKFLYIFVNLSSNFVIRTTGPGIQWEFSRRHRHFPRKVLQMTAAKVSKKQIFLSIDVFGDFSQNYKKKIIG